MRRKYLSLIMIITAILLTTLALPVTASAAGTFTPFVSTGLSHPTGVAVDSGGNVYVVDSGNNRVVKYDSSGNLLTSWGSFGTADGQFNGPWGITVDDSGYIYVTDRGNSRVQKFNTSGAFCSKSLDYVLRLIRPSGVAVPHGWNFSWNQIKALVMDAEVPGIVEIISDDRNCAFISGQGSGDTQFNHLETQIALDGSNNIYVLGSTRDTVRKFYFDGNETVSGITNLSATWGSSGSGNGQFSAPQGIALDGSGNIYVADTGNNRIQELDSSGNFVASWGSFGSGENQFRSPQGITVDGGGNIYVADFYNNRIMKMSALSGDNDITGFAVAGQVGGSTINATNHTVEFHMPNGTDMTALAPTITVSANATINPASGAAQNFSLPISYTVTAQDGTLQGWTVTCVVDPQAVDAGNSTVSAGTTPASPVVNTGFTFTVNVRDASNNPISGLTASDFTITEDGAGSLTVDSIVESGATGDYTVTASHDTAETITITVAVSGVQVGSLVNVVIQAATGSISGTVYDDGGGGGGPIEGATVSVNVGGTDYTATTAMDGTYTITNVPAGSGYTVTASKTGYNSGTVNNVDVTAGSTTVNVNFQLATPVNGVISGVAKDSGNNPISGVTVSLTVSGTVYSAQTDINGTYIISSVPAGSGYTVTASKTGYDSETVNNVTVTAGSTTTVNFTLTAIPAPVAPSITTQPTNQTVTAGQTATFTVAASGDAPLNYQWKKDGNNISDGGNVSGATTATLTISNAQAADAGSYTCYVSNTAGNILSDAATLTVNPVPVTTYTVTYDGNGGTGTAPTESDKAAGATFTAAANSFTAPSGKQFKEWNTAANGTGTSYLAGATVTMPANDLTLYAIWEDIAVVIPSINPASVNFDLAAPADVFTLITWGSSATSVTDVVYGSESLTLDTDYTIDSNKLTISHEYLSGLNLTEGDTADFDITFNDSSVLTLTVNAVINYTPVAPSITTQPISLTVTTGQTATFTVAASGDALLSYQWKKGGSNVSDGGNISGATTATLTISNAQAADAGSYTCYVSNTAGNILSDAATLTVNPVPVTTYTVTYDGNGGTGTAPTESDKAEGTTFTTAANSFTAPAGKQFKEWNTESDGTGTSYMVGATVTMPASNLTLYAIWEDIPVTTYTVTFDSQGGSSVASITSVASGSTITAPAAPTRSGYTFGGWYKESACTNAWNFSTDTVTGNITLYAKWTYNGGGGGGSGSNTPATPTYKADVSGISAGTTMPVDVNTNTGSATTDLGNLAGDIFSGAGTAVITVPSIPGVNSYTLGIPAASLFGSQGEGALTFATGAGSITIPADMLAGISGTEGKKAGITIGQGDMSGLADEVKAAIGDRPIIQLTLTLDGTQAEWNNPEAPVTISIPYTPTAEELANPEMIVIWYIDGSGNAVSVPNGRYDPATGTVTFSTTHFSNYAVGYNKVSFKDVAEGAWYGKAVSFIAAREITTGTGNGNFSPEAKLTRGQFIVMLMKAYGIAPDANPKDNFGDAGSTYYTGYLAAAKRLGISAGVGNNLFVPEKEITRQEMFTLLYNALKVIGKLPQGNSGISLSSFSDAGDIAPWAKDAMTLLVETGTIGGSGGKLTPADTTTRAQMAQVLYILLGK